VATRKKKATDARARKGRERRTPSPTADQNVQTEIAAQSESDFVDESRGTAPSASPSPAMSAIVERARAQAEARQCYEAEDNERGLAWLRKHHGSVGGPYDERFDVPLAAGGVLALLMRADLSTQEGADHFFRMHSTTDGSRPSLDHLRLAQAIGRALDASIMNGSNPANWELVRRAHDDLDATMPKRCAAVAVLRDLRAYRERDDKFRARFPNHRDHPGEGTEFRAWKALESLACLDARFVPAIHSRAACVCDLVRLARHPKLGAIGMAVKLSLDCGAFGDAQAPHEDARKAYRRVKRNYEKAMAEVPT
jgi:hypothetical protein